MRKLVRNSKFFKRYLKTLESAQGYPNQTKELIRQAPVPIIKLLSNAAIYAAKGNIELTPKQKQLFRQKRKLFRVLASHSVPLERKRDYMIQTGGGIAAFIPVLLSTVIPIVGELLFRAINKK